MLDDRRKHDHIELTGRKRQIVDVRLYHLEAGKVSL